LKKKESAINLEVHTDRSLSGGELTPGERKIGNQRQNIASNEI